jgi:uncharacterized protein (TIGR00369 family)
MAFSNKLRRTLSPLDRLPIVGDRLRDLAIGYTVKYAGYSGVRFETLTEHEVAVRLANRRKVRNHIGQIHAAAMFLLAETASGFCIGMNLPDDALPLVKEMNIKYVKRSRGAITATARITDEQIEIVRSTPKGEVTLDVTLVDETGGEPAICQAVWAWVPNVRSRHP